MVFKPFAYTDIGLQCPVYNMHLGYVLSLFSLYLTLGYNVLRIIYI